MQKQENYYLWSHRSKKGVLFWAQNIKVPFGMGHPSACTSNLVYMCAEGFRGHKSSNRIQLSQFIHVLLSFYNLGFFSSRGVGQVGEGVSGDIEGFSYMQTCMCAHMNTCTCM